MDTLKALTTNDMSMTVEPKLPIQWGNQKVLQEEVRWRFGSKSSWKRGLFWVSAIAALIIVLYVLS